MTKIGITGHQKIGTTVQNYVRTRLESSLRSMSQTLVGVTSLAAGADQIFAEVVLLVSGHLEVVVPCADYESTFRDADDLERYRRLLAKSQNTVSLPFSSPSEDAFLAAGRRVVDLSDILFAVWDGQKARGKGGTADIVEYARDLKKEVQIFWPQGANR